MIEIQETKQILLLMLLYPTTVAHIPTIYLHTYTRIAEYVPPWLASRDWPTRKPIAGACQDTPLHLPPTETIDVG